MSGHPGRWLIGAAFAGAVLAAGGAAAASETEKDSKAGGSTTSAGDSVAGGPNVAGGTDPVGREAHAEHEQSGKEADTHPVKFALDLVLGFGKTGVANQDLPGPLGAVNPSNSVGQAKATSESFIIGGAVQLGHFELGARLPLTLGSLDPSTGEQSRGTSALGNFEVEGQYEHEFNDHTYGTFGLGVALPTAQGTEVPANANQLNADATGRIDQTSYDRYSLNQAAAASRGWEENELFAPNRLGIIPRIGVGTHLVSGLTLEGYVKLENLIDTSGNAEHGYVAELVPGARIAYRAAAHFEPGLRVWANVALAGSDENAVAVAEPELRFPFHDFTPTLGVVLPFAGPLTDPYFVGVRAAVAAQF